MLNQYSSTLKIKIANLFSGFNLKGFLNTLGSIIIFMVFGSLYTWSNINVFFVSYLKQYNSPNIEIVDGYFMMPIILVISNFSIYFGTKIEEKFSFKFGLFLSLVMTCGSHFFLIFTTRLPIIYFLMIIFGISIGLSYITTTRNSWYFYPEKKGLISGIILFGYGVSSMIFSAIADNIINPDNEAAENSGFFNKSIADNTYIYIKKLNIILFIMSLLGFFLISDYNKNNPKMIEEKNNNLENSSLIIKEVFKSRQIWLIICLNFCCLYFLYMITNTYRSFGQLNSLSPGLLKYLSSFYAIINGSGRIIWGLLLDRYNLKNLFFSILFSEMIISLTIFYAGQYQFLYFIMVCTCSFLFSGVVVICVIIFPKIYGIKYSNKIYSIACGIYGFSCLLGPIASKVVIKNISDYKKIYLSGFVLSLIAAINLYFLNDNEFIYSSQITNKSLVDFNENPNNQVKEIEFKEF